MRVRLPIGIIVASFILMLPLPASAMIPRYKVIGLGGLDPVYTWSRAFDVSDAGYVVGQSAIQIGHGTRYMGFLWHDGSMLSVGSIDVNCIAFGVNDKGEVVGTIGQHPFFWQNGLMLDLGTLGGAGQALGINNHSQVVGYCGSRAFLWENGVMRSLGPQINHARDINDGGKIVGYQGDLRPVLLQNGQVTRLPTLPGCSWGQATAVNDSGQIVGQSLYTSTGSVQHACLWQNGQVFDLGTLPQGVLSDARDINDSAQIVGLSSDRLEARAVMWENGQIYDLNAEIDTGSGWRLRIAEAINNAGWIVGEATSPSGHREGFLLKPIAQVQIDIMPGNKHNPINPGSNGVTSVAILGSADIDASQVDPSTVTLAGAHVSPRYRPSLRDVNRDHILDIVLQVITREMQIARGVTSAVLEGELVDGTPIEGEDAITVTVGR